MSDIKLNMKTFSSSLIRLDNKTISMDADSSILGFFPVASTALAHRPITI